MAGAQRTDLQPLLPCWIIRPEKDDPRTRIARVVGEEAAACFARAFAGARVYVPKTLLASHPIAIAIGLQAARDISLALGGDCIEMPRYSDASRRQRDRTEIVRLRAHGQTVATIARAVGCSERHVRKVLNQPRDRS